LNHKKFFVHNNTPHVSRQIASDSVVFHRHCAL